MFGDKLDVLRDRFDGQLGRVALIAVAVLLVLNLIIGWYWSREPDTFAIADLRTTEDDAAWAKAGVATTSALRHVATTLLDKPGGFLSNDVTPPSIFLDNMPNWEYGALVQMRDLSKAMREAFSRSQSQSTEDVALARAETRFNFDNKSWALPATESEYRQGIKFLDDYITRLKDDDVHNAQFYARADNLRYWLTTVETRLGSLSQRLSASVGQRRLNTDLAGDSQATQSTVSPGEMSVKTPWLELDDVFYQARGSCWALLHFLKAVEIDFARVLENKNALISLQQIIRELEQTQQALWSPMVLNGSGFGFFANHSLVMASYISRANAALIDLRELLSRG